jgi:hypothetical protein
VETLLVPAALRIAGIAIGAYILIRIVRAAARRLEQKLLQGTGLDVIERTKRAQTLARILQKTLVVIVVVMAGLMMLREADIDITPVHRRHRGRLRCADAGARRDHGFLSDRRGPGARG